MSGRVPVLREYDAAKMLGETIDERHDLIATRHGQRAVGTEVVLYVDHDKGVVVADGVSRGQFASWSFCPVVVAARRQIQSRRVRLSTSSASLIRSSPISTGYVASGASRRSCSGKRSSSRLVCDLMWSSDGDAANRRPSRITQVSSGSARSLTAWTAAGGGALSGDIRSPAMRPAAS